MMTEQILFPLGGAPGVDLEQTGGMNVAVDETFATESVSCAQQNRR
jgi:hypothetical protein